MSGADPGGVENGKFPSLRIFFSTKDTVKNELYDKR